MDLQHLTLYLPQVHKLLLIYILQANPNGHINQTAVLKFSARYIGIPCEPAYIWQGYRVGLTSGDDTSDGRLCITANGYTSFILDGKTGYVGIGNRGQVLQGGDVTLIPDHHLDVSGNTQIRGDLYVGRQ